LIRTHRGIPPVLALVLAAPLCAPAAEQSQLDGNEALFTVMAAINAAGYDADLASNANHPLRKAVRDHLAARSLSSVEDLKKFFAAHRQNTNGAELSQYVSYALSVEGPPAFRYHFKPGELPPDVVPLEGLSELLAEFYKEAKIGELWAGAQPAYEQVIAAYHPLVTRGVTQVNAYLRNPTSGYLGRRFQVIVDLLGPPNQIQTRSYRDDYTIVVTPSAEPMADEVRHAYLHYLVDPLVLKYAEPLDRKRSLFDYAQGAPALDQSYKDDFFLLVTECFIKAVEARLTPGAARKQALVDQALRDGFILTAAFADALPAYETQEQALRLYFRDLIETIDLAAEAKRLDKVQFARERTVKHVKAVPPPPPPEPVGAFKTLAQAEALYSDRQLDRARATYLEVLKAPNERWLHAKAYYGLARIATLQRDPELAEKLFEKSLELRPDAQTRAWSLVYLARLADAQGERDRALEHYRAALAVHEATEGARQAAQQGLQQSFAKQK
jgi:tetratricopeptide (TPR) repeat protein